eukprot:gene2616-4471_t
MVDQTAWGGNGLSPRPETIAAMEAEAMKAQVRADQNELTYLPPVERMEEQPPPLPPVTEEWKAELGKGADGLRGLTIDESCGRVQAVQQGSPAEAAG